MTESTTDDGRRTTNTPADAFNQAVDKWVDQQRTPWMRIKHVTMRSNLIKHLPQLSASEQPLRILDAGGGTGIESIPFAQAGHHVDLVDYSAEMLGIARASIGETHVQGRVALHHANILDIPKLFADGAFDVVLCHNVMQYVGDPDAVLTAISQTLKRGGVFSLISMNRYSLPYREAIFEDDLDKAYTAIDQRIEMTRIFGHEVPIYSGEEIVALLPTHDCELLGHYGIWCMTMYWGNNERKADPILYKKLERLELALSGRHPYNLLGRYFQIVAQKQR